MAIAQKLERIDLDRESKHTEEDATCVIVEAVDQKFHW